MSNRDKILAIVYSAIDQVNDQLPKEKKISKSLETALFGRQGELDSFSLVNFIAAFEQKMDQELDYVVNLTDEEALAQEISPLATVSTLIAYTDQVVDKNT
jgi:acyl carrier protein